MSISDLLQKLSVQKAGDPIRLVCELYKAYSKKKPKVGRRWTISTFGVNC